MKRTGLTLKEAIESGRPFRRDELGVAEWMKAKGKTLEWTDGYDVELDLDDLTATDYQLKPQEPVVFEAEVSLSHRKGYALLSACPELYGFEGERVRVTVEAIEEQS